MLIPITRLLLLKFIRIKLTIKSELHHCFIFPTSPRQILHEFVRDLRGDLVFSVALAKRVFVVHVASLVVFADGRANID